MGLLQWIGLTTAGKPLDLGDPAPDVTAPDQDGRPVRLADYYHSGYTLVYFYPRADTPGCTAEACSLRDEFEVLTERGVRVVGVSADSAASLRRFKEKHRLPFVLLSDEKHAAAQGFGVPTLLGMTHRQSFLVKEGRIVWRDLRASTRWQARDVMTALDRLA